MATFFFTFGFLLFYILHCIHMAMFFYTLPHSLNIILQIF